MAETRTRFDAELAALRADLAAMGEESGRMLDAALDALTASENAAERATAALETVAHGEERVDALDETVEARCLHLLAIQQPVVAVDLRLIGAAMRVATDTERIGDHAVNIARVVRRLRDEGIAYRPLAPVEALGAQAGSLLRRAVTAFAAGDSEGGRTVIADDAAVDALYAAARRDLLQAMQAERAQVALAASLLFILHDLERIADHAVGIAEQAVYLEVAEAPRHRRRSVDRELSGG